MHHCVDIPGARSHWQGSHCFCAMLTQTFGPLVYLLGCKTGIESCHLVLAAQSGSEGRVGAKALLLYSTCPSTARSLDLFSIVVILVFLFFFFSSSSGISSKRGDFVPIWRIFRSGRSIVVWHAVADSWVYGDVGVCASSPRRPVI